MVTEQHQIALGEATTLTGMNEQLCSLTPFVSASDLRF